MTETLTNGRIFGSGSNESCPSFENGFFFPSGQNSICFELDSCRFKLAAVPVFVCYFPGETFGVFEVWMKNTQVWLLDGSENGKILEADFLRMHAILETTNESKDRCGGTLPWRKWHWLQGVSRNLANFVFACPLRISEIYLCNVIVISSWEHRTLLSYTQERKNPPTLANFPNCLFSQIFENCLHSKITVF